MTGPFLANAVEIAGEWVPELLGLFNGIYCEHFFILGIGRIRGNLGGFFSSALVKIIFEQILFLEQNLIFARHLRKWIPQSAV